MGLMKGGLPSFRRQPGPVKVGPTKGTIAVPSPIISNGVFFTLGIALLVIGIDAVVVPGYLVLKSTPIIGAGVALSLLGAYAMYLGSRKPKEA
jgi:hypothetical protein